MDRFVTREEYAAGMLQIRSDIFEMKSDLKMVLRNQLPPWFRPLVTGLAVFVVLIIQHYWK